MLKTKAQTAGLTELTELLYVELNIKAGRSGRDLNYSKILFQLFTCVRTFFKSDNIQVFFPLERGETTLACSQEAPLPCFHILILCCITLLPCFSSLLNEYRAQQHNLFLLCLALSCPVVDFFSGPCYIKLCAAGGLCDQCCHSIFTAYYFIAALQN